MIEKYISVSEVTLTVVWGGETLTLPYPNPFPTLSLPILQPRSQVLSPTRLLPFIIPFIAVHQSVHRSVGTGRREPWERGPWSQARRSKFPGQQVIVDEYGFNLPLLKLLTLV